MSGWTLCIDFGTAYSKAAAAPSDAWDAFDPARVRPLMLSPDGAGNAFLLESAVFIDAGHVMFGRPALERADALSRERRVALRSFKTLLSVSDLDRALNTNAPAAIDPHRVFQMRDLVVLYLAYLLASAERAVRADAMLAKADLAFRYAAPAWRRGDSAGMHGPILRLFAEAEAFRCAAGKKLLAPEGVAIEAISKLLPKASEAPEPIDMGLIFEATAAASYTSIGLEESGTHFIVLDMGAGTTDIAALARIGERAIELPEARVTLKQAGDFIDQLIANRALDVARWAKGDEQQALWSALMRRMRDVKEALFEDGRVIFRHAGRNVTLAMKDIERDRDFKSFMKTLADAYAHSLAVVRDDATARHRTEVQAVAVGGGAAAPFIRELVARKKGGRPRVLARPATPDWAHAPAFGGNLAPVFPQLAIAIGGALAPESMLAARGGVSPAASDRSDIPAARD